MCYHKCTKNDNQMKVEKKRWGWGMYSNTHTITVTALEIGLGSPSFSFSVPRYILNSLLPVTPAGRLPVITVAFQTSMIVLTVWTGTVPVILCKTGSSPPPPSGVQGPSLGFISLPLLPSAGLRLLRQSTLLQQVV